MQEEERKIAEIEQDLYNLMLEEKFVKELDQDRINQEYKEGYTYIHDHVFAAREVDIDDDFSIYIPTGFESMNPAFIERKYPSRNRPACVFTNYTTEINITFSRTPHQMKAYGFSDFADNLMNSMRKLYPDSDFSECQVLPAAELEIRYFDFITPALDQSIYNLMFLLLDQNQVMYGGINCPEKNKELWKVLGIAAMASLERKDREAYDR